MQSDRHMLSKFYLLAPSSTFVAISTVELLLPMISIEVRLVGSIRNRRDSKLEDLTHSMKET